MLFALQAPLLKARREVALLRYVFAQDAEIAFGCFAEGDTAAGNLMEGAAVRRAVRTGVGQTIGKKSVKKMICTRFSGHRFKIE